MNLRDVIDAAEQRFRDRIRSEGPDPDDIDCLEDVEIYTDGETE